MFRFISLMDKNHGFLSCFISGGFAGASIDLTLHPLDYMKTRIHRRQKLDKDFRSFYKGISASLVASFPCAATFWGVYMITRQNLSNHLESRPLIESFSSICGSFACCLVRSPFERIKQLAQTHENSKPLTIGRVVLSQEGVHGLYKGFSALAFREVPFDTIQMLIFQTVKYFGFFGSGENASYAYGALAGGITAFITTPIDVIKTFTMVESAKYTGMIRGFQIFYKEHGFFALWRGWMIRTVYISLGGMMFFGVFNSCLMRLA